VLSVHKDKRCGGGKRTPDYCATVNPDQPQSIPEGCTNIRLQDTSITIGNLDTLALDCRYIYQCYHSYQYSILQEHFLSFFVI